MKKRWRFLEADENKAAALQNELQISPVICKMLVSRGIESYQQARDFFRPELEHLHDPWLMKDMAKAVERIISAFSRKEKILILGDYDVDGTTAVAILLQFLYGMYDQEKLDFYIPHRYKEGYGISKTGIDFAIRNSFSLIISVDCGIKSVDLVSYAQQAGIDFIICDHHLPDKVLPPASAILNPKQADCNYPFKDLCGCGVAFKLMTALVERMGKDKNILFHYLDLVATAIAADIVSMTGENRILTYHGLIKINSSPCEGIKALIQLSGLQKVLQITNVVFAIAPRINAAGRMDDARKAVQMFIERDFTKALALAEMLHSDNSARKAEDLRITQEALAIISGDDVLISRKSTVVFRPHWHKGVVGIVASRLIEKYYRPTIVLTQSGELVAGSARSVHGFNLYEAIHACGDHLLAYGGHFAAAGMTLLPEQVEAFISKFEEVVASTILPELLIPEIVIDAEVILKDLTPSFYKIICQMEPFGPLNLRPVFIAKNVTDTGWSKIVKDDHIKFSIRQDDKVFGGIGFNLADKFSLLQDKKPIDIVFTLDENEWKNEKHLQLKVIDFQPTEQ